MPSISEMVKYLKKVDKVSVQELRDRKVYSYNSEVLQNTDEDELKKWYQHEKQA